MQQINVYWHSQVKCLNKYAAIVGRKFKTTNNSSTKRKSHAKIHVECVEKIFIFKFT